MKMEDRIEVIHCVGIIRLLHRRAKSWEMLTPRMVEGMVKALEREAK